ncbi:MAG: phosphoribosylanthranilate isomerase [Nitrospinota bacterium]|nr:phosphoribosylanthranilate isomerase [Nitrospinota bacterium]
MKVKICGQTSLADADLSVRMGADYIGVVFEVESSPRSLDMEKARPIFEKHRDRTFLLTCDASLEKIGNAAMELDPYAIQLTGQETPEDVANLKDEAGGVVFKSIHLPPAGEEGAESPEQILERMKLYVEAGVDGFVLDTSTGGLSGGTGTKSDWAVAARITAASPAQIFIAGGINAENAAEAAAMPNIYGIDLASGAESETGVKSEEKLAALFAALGRAQA